MCAHVRASVRPRHTCRTFSSPPSKRSASRSGHSNSLSGSAVPCYRRPGSQSFGLASQAAVEVSTVAIARASRSEFLPVCLEVAGTPAAQQAAKDSCWHSALPFPCFRSSNVHSCISLSFPPLSAQAVRAASRALSNRPASVGASRRQHQRASSPRHADKAQGAVAVRKKASAACARCSWRSWRACVCACPQAKR